MRELDALRRRYEGHQAGLLGARRNFAVLVPFVELEGQTHLIFEVRSKNVRQGGEVCFPGGAMEPGETPIQCALRETEEELSIPAGEITVLGESDFLANQENFLLRPVLGVVSEAGYGAIRPSKAEVAQVFTVPLRFFYETAPQIWHYDLEAKVPADFPYETVGISRDYPWRGGRVSVPIWTYEGHIIWGMTGRILRDLTKE